MNLGGEVDNAENISINKVTESEKKSTFTEKVIELVEKFKGSTENDRSKDWGAYDIANQAFDVMQSTIARQKLAVYPADYSIEIARNACGTLEFDRAAEMIGLGYEKAQKVLG